MSNSWYDIRNPQDPQLDELARRFGIHALHIEDCRHRNQSAKVEYEGSYLFVVLKPVQLDGEGCLDAVDLDLFLGPDWLITVQESQCTPLSEMLERIKSNSGLGVDQVFYRILDGLVDSYLPVLDTISESIDKMEDDSLQCPEPPLLERIFDTRRTLIQLRRIFANTRDVVGHLLRDQTPQIRPELTPFFRDVYDHIVRDLDGVEIQRDLVTGAMELYLSSVANRTNQIMKVLTIFGTIATPALVITGLYGMNLHHLPLAERADSWSIVIAIIAAASALMLLLLRKARWI